MSEATCFPYFLRQEWPVRQSFLVIFVISVVALTASFWLEVFAKIEPCKLCQVQRACYFFAMLFAIVGAFSWSTQRGITVFLLALSLCNLVLSSYQFGIQLGVFSDMCGVIAPATLHDFKHMLFQQQLSQNSCATMTWVFGLPVVMWSTLFSFACCVISVAILRLSSDRTFGCFCQDEEPGSS